MMLRVAAVSLLLFILVGFGKGQRRTWKLPGVVGLQTQQTNSKPQRPTYEPSQDLLGLHKIVQQKPVLAQPGQNEQDVLHVQPQQLLQGPTRKMIWKFPKLAQQPTQPPVPFYLQQPVPPKSVAAECGENRVYVEVKQNFFGTKQLLMPSLITLGACGPVGQDVDAHVLVFEFELHECNSTLRMTEDELVYTFMLISMSEVYPGTSITRLSNAVVSIECHYPRKKNVTSSGLVPAWVPYASTKVVEEELIFSLSLMTDDWQYERPSNQYYLGSLMNIEASVMQFHHVPLRVFVDRCVATPVPDINAVTRYAFIENHGCLVDAEATGSSSHFLPQDQNDKLRFQLEVFKFQEGNSNMVYITCFLKVTAASAPSDSEHKACSFAANRWTPAYGDDQVCGCCSTNCGSRKGRDTTSGELLTNGKVTLGPVVVEDAVAGEPESLFEN